MFKFSQVQIYERGSMKIDRFNILITMSVFMFSLICGDVYADTIFLKSGRIIKCSKITKENDVIKCFVNGYEIGFPQDDVDRIVFDKNAGRKSLENGFTFDAWQAGMSIDEVMITAERNDIPLHRHGLFSANKHYNPKICREYIHTATEFYYNDLLMGKPAVVTLYFTPTSKLLSRLKIHLHANDINRKSSYVKEIAIMLSEKYGKPSRIIDMNIFHDSISWKGDISFNVLMETGTGRLNITYSDTRLHLIGQKERNAIKAKNIEQYHLKDTGKF